MHPATESLLHTMTADTLRLRTGSEEPGQGTPVRNPVTIRRLLLDAGNERVSLTIRFACDERRHPYRSTIHDVGNDGRILLHRLTPSSWQMLVGKGQDVDVRYQLPTGLFTCRSLLAPLEQDADDSCCILHQPQTLYHLQLRTSYRVSLPARGNLIALPIDTQTLSGYCLNISMEGACCVFSSALARQFRERDTLSELHFSLGEQFQFSTAAEIRRIEHLENGHLRVGLRFHPLDADTQRNLQTCLTRLQRELLQKKNQS